MCACTSWSPPLQHRPLSPCAKLGQRVWQRPASNCRGTPSRGGGRTAALSGRRLLQAEVEAESPEAASTSGRCQQPAAWQHTAAASVRTAAVAAALLLPAGAAHASEAAAPGFLEFIITYIESLGPWGPAAFVSFVCIAECIPLFPTQPLSLASGLLFGAQKGSLCMLSGTTLAALLAFSIARGIGRPLAEKIINHEMSGADGGNGAEGSGPVQRKLAEVQQAIERGSFWQQAGAVLLLRLTPVVPFSASNYVLGLSPLPLPPYLAGTAAGMAFWSILYASLGGASRSLLRRGVDPDVLLADLLDKAGSYTRELATLGLVAGSSVLLYVGVAAVRRQLAGAAAGGGEAGLSNGTGGSAAAPAPTRAPAAAPGSNPGSSPAAKKELVNSGKD